MADIILMECRAHSPALNNIFVAVIIQMNTVNNEKLYSAMLPIHTVMILLIWIVVQNVVYIFSYF